MPNNPKQPTPEQMIEYIHALETGNKQLVISLKRCLELLANVPPEVADSKKWKGMLYDFNKIVKSGEKITTDKINRTLH